MAARAGAGARRGEILVGRVDKKAIVNQPKARVQKGGETPPLPRRFLGAGSPRPLPERFLLFGLSSPGLASARLSSDFCVCVSTAGGTLGSVIGARAAGPATPPRPPRLFSAPSWICNCWSCCSCSARTAGLGCAMSGSCIISLALSLPVTNRTLPTRTGLRLAISASRRTAVSSGTSSRRSVTFVWACFSRESRMRLAAVSREICFARRRNRPCPCPR